jgi:hypothetical protein
MPPLAGLMRRPIQKLRDADAVLDEVSEMWNAYRGSTTATFEPRIDPTVGALEYVARIPVEPPIKQIERRLRAVVADGRSALDNAVHAIGVREELSEAQAKKNAFPILSDSTRWADGRRRLKGLPADVVDRVERVQPYHQSDDRLPPHPLEVLRELSNADKHQDGFAVGLSPSVVNTHLLGELNLVLPREAAADLARPLTASDVDQMIDLNLNHVHDGAVVVRIRIPGLASAERLEVGPLDLPLMLNTSLRDGAPAHPVIPTMRNALRFARETVRYITGGTDDVPVAFSAGMLHRDVCAP